MFLRWVVVWVKEEKRVAKKLGGAYIFEVAEFGRRPEEWKRDTLSSESNRLSASLEDYLEAMLFVILEKNGVRAKDIADRLGVSRSSVTSALQVLASKGLINYAPYDVITLTPEGEKQAERVLRKHTVLQEFFTDILLIDPEKAEAVACKMEHEANEALVERLSLLSQYVMESAESPADWREKFTRYCRERKLAQKAEK